MATITANIAEGKYDKSLDRIIKACQDRKAERIYNLHVGDRVRFPNTVRPTYLRGMTAKIVEWRRTRVLVELEGGPTGKFRTGKIIAFPASLIPVDEED